MTKFAAYNDQAIWGIGDTPAAARLDAATWLDGKRGDTPAELRAMASALAVAPMSAALADLVEKNGGNIGHYLVDDVLISRAELDARP